MTSSKSPHLVDWAITERCNLSCRHCRGMLRGDISTERARTLVSEIAGLGARWVIVEGGEPLLRTDLFELLELMQQRKLTVYLITNGMLLTAPVIERLKSLGVRLMVSLDGATPRTYEEIRVGASFNRVLRSISEAVRAGLLEAVNFTVGKTNYREIPSLFALAAKLGIPRITFIGLKPCHNHPVEFLSANECETAIRLACGAAEQTGIGFFFDEPFFWSAVREWGLPVQQPETDAGILVSSTSACIFGEYLFIEPSGDVRPCSFAPMTVGNVRNKPLGAIWQEMLDSPLINRIKNAENRNGNCGNCAHRADCKGCRSRSFALSGDWFAADPTCPLSLKKAEVKI